jgi:23S rRNA (guanosine2251-2'-O)-methyltransferase
MTPPTRLSLAGIGPIRAALAAGEPVRVLLVGRDDDAEEILALVATAEAQGADIWRGGPGDLLRMSRGAQPERALAMLGPSPRADLDAVCGRGGALFLLNQAAYPSNVGFAVRTAEVAGFEAVVVDARFNHEQRGRVSHVSMGADRLLPVLWESTDAAFAAARAHGLRIVALEALEHEGARLLGDVDLRGGVMIVVGNERDGVGAELLARCDAIAAIPMAGFVPSYNLHAAIAMVAAERLRQLSA